MKILLMTASCALLASGCATNPANDPLQVRLNDIDARLGNVRPPIEFDLTRQKLKPINSVVT